MAKSSRASRIKKNNQALKANVFGPVEAARNERLSAKLMELAQQPKPPKAEMETEQEDKDAGSEAKAEGSLLPLSAAIPASLLADGRPPLTTPMREAPPETERAQELLFYHLLGISADVVGFDEGGQLLLSFAQETAS